MKRSIAIILSVCLLVLVLAGCANTNANTGNADNAAPANTNGAAEAPAVKGLVIDTLAQGPNLHEITDEAAIKTAYGIYCKYAEEKACQKEESNNTKQLLRLTFTMTDGSEQTADFYQEGSGKYYMDKGYKGYSTVEKTVGITEEDFNTIKGLLK